MSVFKDFPGLENLEKNFKDFQGPTRALIVTNFADQPCLIVNFLVNWSMIVS